MLFNTPTLAAQKLPSAFNWRQLRILREAAASRQKVKLVNEVGKVAIYEGDIEDLLDHSRGDKLVDFSKLADGESWESPPMQVCFHH
jgi:hypothetical protein